jgi:hypothetical protein
VPPRTGVNENKNKSNIKPAAAHAAGNQNRRPTKTADQPKPQTNQNRRPTKTADQPKPQINLKTASPAQGPKNQKPETTKPAPEKGPSQSSASVYLYCA